MVFGFIAFMASYFIFDQSLFLSFFIGIIFWIVFSNDEKSKEDFEISNNPKRREDEEKKIII